MRGERVSVEHFEHEGAGFSVVWWGLLELSRVYRGARKKTGGDSRFKMTNHVSRLV